MADKTISKLKKEIKAKGWKQTLEKDTWYKPKQRYVMTRVWKPALSKRERIRRGINTYGFFGRIENPFKKDVKVTKKFFPKKSQALKEQIKFMLEN